jgi:tyrosyl-tRNA synthetase
MTGEFFGRLRERAVEIHVEDHLRARLERGESLRVKLGLDPTAPDLHVGHLVVLDALRAFQDDGHTVVIIIGDYTALIGDPSGRSETRPVLTPEQVATNAETYFEQVDLVLDRDRIEVRYNSEWLAAMTAADILRLMSKATLHQLFNLLFGREIQKSYGQDPQDIAVFPLLEGTDGSAKMSKSLGNYIGLAEPPEEIYGKTMSIPDRLMEKYLRLVSGLPTAEVENVLAMKPRDAKAALARQLVKRLHGEEAAARAEADFDRKFRQRDVPESMPERRISKPRDLVETLVEVEFAKSGTEARRLIEQGGVRINGDKASADAELHDSDILQVGKRSFVRIRLG